MTKVVSYKQSNRLTEGIFHKFKIFSVVLLGVPRTLGQDLFCNAEPSQMEERSHQWPNDLGRNQGLNYI